MAWLPDPNGSKLPEPHPCIFLKDARGIELIHTIAITGSFTTPIAPSWWKMPWAHGRHPVTGLDKPCVAKVEWRPRIPESAVLEIRGMTPDVDMVAILYRLEALLKPGTP